MVLATLFNISSKSAKGLKKAGGKIAATGRRISIAGRKIMDDRCITNTKGRAGVNVYTEMDIGSGFDVPRRLIDASGAFGNCSSFITSSALFSD